MRGDQHSSRVNLIRTRNNNNCLMRDPATELILELFKEANAARVIERDK